ncbi:hypothetical protein N7528_006746 [Penicillium herquei]|nr:hypothetical protein N7528_006746 [Penicillium herquei]
MAKRDSNKVTKSTKRDHKRKKRTKKSHGEKKAAPTESNELADETLPVPPKAVVYGPEGKPRGLHRKWPKQDPPITDPHKIPKEWKWDIMELDITEDDIEANIERCHERIETGIMPQVFEIKLEGFMKRKAAREKMMTSEPGLSFDVARRLDSLKHMRDHYEGKTSEEDVNSYINIKALIKAYRSGEIDWYNGEKFTIWAKGKLLRGPIDFKSANLGALYKEYEETDGLWVEGFGSSGPSFFGHVLTIPPAMGAGHGLTQHYVSFAMKVPGTGDELASIAEFRDDTGASAPVVTMRDIRLIESICGRKARHLGSALGREVMGRLINGHQYSLEVCIVNNPSDRAPMTRWVKTIFFAVEYEPPSDGERSCRLSGAWWRHMLYTATVPDNRKRLYAAQEKGELCDAIPKVDWMIARAPTVPPSRDPSNGPELAPVAQQTNDKESPPPLEPWMPEGYQQGSLRPPTYLQYLEWLEDYNRDLSEDEEQLIPTWENYQQYRLIQAHWTTQTDARMQPPTWNQYLAHVHRQNLASEADTPLGMAPRYVTADLPGYFEFRLDQRNWTAEHLQVEEMDSDNSDDCLVQ